MGLDTVAMGAKESLRLSVLLELDEERESSYGQAYNMTSLRSAQ
jgi:hypothetical protein